MPIVPSVTMNGISRRPTIIMPLDNPASVEARIPSQHRDDRRERRMQFRERMRMPVRAGAIPTQNRRHRHDRQRDERTGRQINARADDDHRHAQTRCRINAALAQNIFQVAQRVKFSVLHQQREKREHEDEREKPAEQVCPFWI